MTRGLSIEIRDKRLRGEHLNISAQTTNAKVRDAREAMIRGLLDNGDHETIELIRTRRIHISDAHAAYKRGTLAALRPEMRAREKPLGASVDALMGVVKATRETGTLLTYASYTDSMIATFGSEAALGDITPEMAQAFLYGPKKDGRPWAPTSQRTAKMLARRVWRAGGATADPWKDIVLPKVRATRVAFLQPGEWQRLHESVAGSPYCALLAVGCLAGLRISETLNLRPGIDIDLQRRVIHIQPRGGEFKWRPKTDNSIRDVPMSATLAGIIERHIASGFAGERYLMIAAKRDRPVGYNSARKWVHASFVKAGIKYGRGQDALTSHSLRHTFASWLAQEDVQLLKIAKLLGDTIETVAKYYSHLTNQDLADAVDIVDGISRRGA